MPEIIAGRDWDDLKKYGSKGTITIGKNIVGTGAEVHLTAPIMIDVLRPHVVVVVGKRGTGKCVLPSTEIILGDEKKIGIEDLFKKSDKDLIEKGEDDEIYEVKGLKVISLNKDLKEENRHASIIYRKKINEKLLRIRTKTGREVTVTKEHPLLVLENNKPKWVESQKIPAKSHIAVRKKEKNAEESDIFWDKITEIEEISYKGWVYDLTVPQTHNFIAGSSGGIFCHNSYTSQIFAEEVTKLPEEVLKNLCIISIDTQGIFWTMKYPNHKQRDLLYEWGLKPQSFEAYEYVPIGHMKKFQEMGVVVDAGFSFRPNDLSASDWCYTFGLAENDLDGILLSRVINSMKGSYSILDIVEEVKKGEFEDRTKAKLQNMFLNANDWGIFSQNGMDIYEFLKPGKIVIFDVSMFGGGVGWNVKSLVVGLLMKKVYDARVIARREEELATIEDSEDKTRKVPLCWLITDEAHNFIPSQGSTASSDIILTIIRQGRQPGVSQLFITQMPDKLHPDVLAQADIVIAHRLTSQRDIDALKAIMQTYMLYSIEKYLDELPKLKGVALIFDDNSERMYKIRVRPRQSWHGGESPVAL